MTYPASLGAPGDPEGQEQLAAAEAEAEAVHGELDLARLEYSGLAEASEDN